MVDLVNIHVWLYGLLLGDVILAYLTAQCHGSPVTIGPQLSSFGRDPEGFQSAAADLLAVFSAQGG